MKQHSCLRWKTASVQTGPWGWVQSRSQDSEDSSVLPQWVSRHTSAKAWNPLAVSQTRSDRSVQVYDNGCSDAACWRTSERKSLVSRSMCVKDKNRGRTEKCAENKRSHWSAINIQINTLFVGFVIHRKHEVLPQTANLWCLLGSVSHMLPLSAYETLATGKNRRKVFG